MMIKIKKAGEQGQHTLSFCLHYSGNWAYALESLATQTVTRPLWHFLGAC